MSGAAAGHRMRIICGQAVSFHRQRFSARRDDSGGHAASRRDCQRKFLHGLTVGDLGDAELALFAEDAWERFSKIVTFDYPQVRMTCSCEPIARHIRRTQTISQGIHPNIYVLAELLEEEVHQTHDHDHNNDHDHH